MDREAAFAYIKPTAFSIVALRADSGIPYTKEIAEMTRAGDKLVEVIGGAQNAAEVKNRLTVWAELRFVSLSAAVQNEINILELAAGFAPRGLIFAADMRAYYVSTDLAGMHEARMSVMHNLNAPRQPRYAMVDVTNTDEVVGCAKHFARHGTIAVVNEGLLSYFTHEQKLCVAQNIRALLGETGGSWWTTDIHTKQEWAHMERSSKTASTFQKNVGCNFADRSFDHLDQAEEMMGAAGFAVRRYKQLDLSPPLNSPVINDDVQQVLENQHLWQMVPA